MIFTTIDSFRYYLNLQKIINEGLIKTHDIDKSVEIFNDTLQEKAHASIDILGRIEIILFQIDTDTKEDIETILFNLGYFIATVEYMLIDKTIHNIGYDKFDETLIDRNRIVGMSFYAERLYNKKYENTIPKYLYHVTESDLYENKIKHKGLIPINKRILSNGPGRIYFTMDTNESKRYADNKFIIYDKAYKTYKDSSEKYPEKYDKHYIKENITFYLLKIKTNKEQVIYHDPQMTNAFYTMHNINIKDIEVIDKKFGGYIFNRVYDGKGRSAYRPDTNFDENSIR